MEPDNDCACSSYVTNIPGHSAFAYVSKSKLEVNTTDSRCEAIVSAAEKRKKSEKSTEEAQVIRTYGTFKHLVLKTLNRVLADVEDIGRSGSDVVHAGSRTNTMVAAKYIGVG